VAALALVAAGGIGYVAIPGADSQVKGCYATNGPHRHPGGGT
jgi:hypothetical protein